MDRFVSERQVIAVINDGEVTLKHNTAYDNAAERVVNLVPEMFDKVTGLVKKTKKDSAVDKAVDEAVDAPVEPEAK